MSDEEQCPRCDSHNTERVHTEEFGEGIQHVYICRECPTQYTVVFGRPIVEDVYDTEEDETVRGY